MENGAGTWSEGTGREFRLGRAQLWLAAGFLAAVLAFDQALARSPYASVGPLIHTENQLGLLAHATRTDADDVLFLGSSRLRAAVDSSLVTEFLTHRTAPSAVAGRLQVQGLDAWLLERLLADYVVPRPPRELLVIGIEARLFYTPPYETDDLLGVRLVGRATDLFRFDPFELNAVQRSQWSQVPLRGVLAPYGLPWILSAESRRKLDLLREHRGTAPLGTFDAIDPREFRQARAIRERIDTRRQSVAIEDVALRPASLAAFGRSLDLLERLPCETVFVRLPVRLEFDVEQARQLADFERLVVGELSARGLRYVDLNALPELRDPARFKDETHVTPEGAEQVSLLLARDVVLPELWDRVPPAFRGELAGRLGPLAP
ncbi:MAG TPA: hypothetical protein VJP77_02700, partial [Planctomycetota bacterium]|nr:hypothetical protein [Planctomycetota bacterium]